MSVLDRLQAVRKGIKSVVVETKTLGRVELLPFFMKERMRFLKNANAKDERDFSLLLIALSISEDDQRLADSLDIDELMDMLNPLGATPEGLEDLNDLFMKANELSAVTQNDVEQAQKN